MAKEITKKGSVSSAAGNASAVLDHPEERKDETVVISMSSSTPANADAAITVAPAQPRKRRLRQIQAPFNRFSAMQPEEDVSNRQAEQFYLQKQIQQQTPMVIILEDGERVQGVIEWYDRYSIKVRGKSRVLVYKSAIKYLYKAGEIGTAPEN